MKARQIEDAWRHVAEKPYPIKLNSFDFSHVSGLRNGSLSFSSGVNVVCGGNGVGKSTLLHAIFSLLKTAGATCDVDVRLSPKTEIAQLEAALFVQGNQVSIKTESRVAMNSFTDVDAARVSLDFIDVASDVIRLREKVSCTDNLEEALQQVEGADEDDDGLERVAYFMGRSYSKITVYELDLGMGFEETPFFEVTVSGTNYDSRSMGLGELTIIYLLWKLERARAPGIMLIEEPEVFMSPLSQLRFANILAEVSARRKLWFVVSTHSPALVTQVTEQAKTSVGLIQHAAAGGEIVGGPKLPAMLRSLGMVPNKRYFIFVEDASSARLLRFILASEDMGVMDEVQLIVCGGESAVEEMATQWHSCRGFTLGAVFLLDGDMRAKPDWVSATRDFLPGDTEPERLVKTTVSANVRQFSLSTGRSEGAVQKVLGEIDGLDIHDWAPQLAARLGLSLDTVFTIALSVWAASPEARALCQAMLLSLNAALVSSEMEIKAAL